MKIDPWQGSFLIGLISCFWFLGKPFRTISTSYMRSGILLFACLLMGVSFLTTGLVGVMLVLLSEVVIVSDRYLGLRARHVVSSEREFASLFFYVLPIFCTIFSTHESNRELFSALISLFLVARLMAWPVLLPFKYREEFPFHSVFSIFWCNLAIFLLCKEMILTSHVYLFGFVALLNAVSGSFVAATTMTLVYICSYVPEALYLAGVVGVALAWKRIGLAAIGFLLLWCTFDAAGGIGPELAWQIMALFILIQVFEEKTNGSDSFFQMPWIMGLMGTCGLGLAMLSTTFFLRTISIESGICVLLYVVLSLVVCFWQWRRPFAFADIPAVDIYKWFFGALTYYEKKEKKQVIDEASSGKKKARSAVDYQFVGSLGQYLLWLLVLAVALAMGGLLL